MAAPDVDRTPEPEHDRQLEIARRVMRENATVLGALAGGPTLESEAIERGRAILRKRRAVLAALAKR